MKVLLAGGGTGGHVYPAIAVGDALRERGHEVVYAGDAGRLEGRVAPERGYRFLAVKAPQFPRAGVVAKAVFAWRLLGAVVAARALVAAERPDVVLGVGGYIMAPPVLAAWTLGVPVAVHEANLTPGLANRLCALVARVVFLTYDATRPRLRTSAEVLVVGCPVHPRVFQGERSAARARYHLGPGPVVLLVGGSLGAAALNTLGLAAAGDPQRGFQLLWIAGPRYVEEVRAALGEPPPGVVLVGYEDRMGDAYAAADLVVARAGSATLAELTALGLPAVLVPSPNVTDNHQEGNARGLEAAGAAEVVLERDLEPTGTVARLRALVVDHTRLLAMGAASRVLGRPEVARVMAERLEGLALAG